MPRIKELAGFKNGRLGHCVDSQGVPHGPLRADIVTYVAENAQMPTTALERFVEGRYSIPGCQVRVHCFDRDTLRFAFCVADAGSQIDEDWWER